MHMGYYSYKTTGRMNLSNRKIDYFKACNTDNIGMKSAHLYSK